MTKSVSARDAYAGRGRRSICPPALFYGEGRRGKNCSFILNSFHFSYLVKVHFPVL